MRKKALFAHIIDKFVPDFLLSFFYRSARRDLTILAYHRITDDKINDFPFDFELISADRDNFEYQVQHVKKHFNPITLEQLVLSLEGGISLPDKPILITFDDGFDDNYYNAFPILKKYAVPATIFVSAGFVSTDKVLWFDEIAAIVKQTTEEYLMLDVVNEKFSLGSTLEERELAAQNICEFLKRVPNKIRLEVLSLLKEAYSGILAETDLSKSKILSWEQIQEMNQSVISFGSHTMTHPILTNLNDDELEYELRQSKKVLESKLGATIDTFAYPNGGITDISHKIDDMLERLGYKVSFSYLPGTNPLPIKSKYRLKRIHVEHHINKSYFNWLLCFPGVFSD